MFSSARRVGGGKKVGVAGGGVSCSTMKPLVHHFHLVRPEMIESKQKTSNPF